MQSAAADDAASLRALADAARTTLSERVEPPEGRLPFLCTVRRTDTAPIREYILREQGKAIDALLASARTPGEATRVRRLLGELQRDGYSRAADARLAEIVPGGPTGLRLAASLGELPAALHERLHPGDHCGSTYFGLVGRTFLPLGALARTDYQRLAELEPANPWHALVLAWLDGIDGEPALQRALAAGQSTPGSDSLRVQIFAWQQLAWLHVQQQRAGEAERAARKSMRMADELLQRAGDDLAQPAVEQALGDAAQSGSVLASVLEDTGQHAAAFDLLLDVAAQQRRLAELRPEATPAQIALIDTLGRLAGLHDVAGPSAASGPAAKAYLDEAVALYRRLEQRAPYSPILGRSAWPGIFMTAVSMAGGLTLVAGWVLLRRYRRRIAELMMASSRGSATSMSPSDESLTRRDESLTRSDKPLAPAAVVHPPSIDDADAITAQAAATLRRAALVQVAAGLAFGVAAAWLQLRADDTEPSVLRMTLSSWTWGWPTVLALGFVWDGDRRRRRLAWSAYFAGLLLICTVIALGDTRSLTMFGVTVPPFFQGLVFWAVSLSFSPLLLLFLNRAVRSIGPALLAMMLVATCCGVLALVAASTPAGMSVLASVSGALGLPAGAVLPATLLIGMVAAAPLAWGLGRRLRAAYAARWLSDQSLMIDTLWGFQAVLLAFGLAWSIGPAGWLALGVFALHKGITLAGMAPAVRASRRHRPLRLLLLRVFTRRDRRGRLHSRRGDAERLFDLLGSRWRYAGPIAMIGAPDLASSTIDPDEFLDFVAGRLHERFIVDPAEVPARLAAMDDRCDPDARWRVTELFCGNDAWRAAVLALMARSDVVAMDLRDFGPDNQGCIFELQSLVDLVPAARVALLVDGSTRRDFLQDTIAACLGRAPVTSPNKQGDIRFAIIDVAGGEQAAVDRLFGMARSLDG